MLQNGSRKYSRDKSQAYPRQIQKDWGASLVNPSPCAWSHAFTPVTPFIFCVCFYKVLVAELTSAEFEFFQAAIVLWLILNDEKQCVIVFSWGKKMKCFVQASFSHSLPNTRLLSFFLSNKRYHWFCDCTNF